MSFFDALLGRTKLKSASLDQLFGLTTAGLTLETEFSLTPTGAAAICFKGVGTGEFRRLETDIHELLTTSTKDSPLQWKTLTDRFSYQWITLEAEEFENAVATVYMISRELQDAGYGELLLASVFQFRGERGVDVFWMYNYKRGSFYPFVPFPDQQRDNALELRLSSILGSELSIESDLSKWYALWGIPLNS